MENNVAAMLMHKYSFWTRDEGGKLTSSICRMMEDEVKFVHYSESEPKSDFRTGTYWTEFETDSSSAAGLGTGIGDNECLWRSVLTLTRDEAGKLMMAGRLRWAGPVPVREYRSDEVIPFVRVEVIQMTQP